MDYNINLESLAISLYSKNVSSRPDLVKSASETAKKGVLDVRDKGYRCSYCKKYSKNPIAFEKQDQVVYNFEPLSNSANGLLIANTHYCGCRGWD